jgi:hypothetical protein
VRPDLGRCQLRDAFARETDRVLVVPLRDFLLAY